MTFVKDRFSLDGGNRIFGWHDPTFRWNGFACPYFPIESVRQIKLWLDRVAAEHPGEETPRLEIDSDGRVWWAEDAYDPRIEEKPVNAEHRLRDDPSFPAVPVHSIGAFAWIWLEHRECLCDEPECETRDGGRTVVCTICGGE